MIIILIIILNYMKRIWFSTHNVKSNEQFLIFTRTTSTRPDPIRPAGQPDPRATLFKRQRRRL